MAKIEIPDPFNETVYVFCIKEEHKTRVRMKREILGKGCGCHRCRIDSVLDHTESSDRLDWLAGQNRWAKKPPTKKK